MSTAGLPYGLQAMLKEGHKHFQGLDESVLRNIEACKGLAEITRTSMGPNGMNKMIINHLDKLFVTSDTAAIASELEVQHPAARMIVLAAQAQQQEIGDGTNLVISLAGELLSNAEDLIRDGLQPTEIAEGYRTATERALAELETLVVEGTGRFDPTNAEDVMKRIRGSVASKQYGYEDALGALIAKACIAVCPAKNPANFNVDNVRTCKIPGGGLANSEVVQGMVIPRGAEGTVTRVSDAKVCVFAQGVEAAMTETKGTVLIKSAEELTNYAKSEEARMEAIVKGIADAGVKLVVSGSAISEIALHFLEKYGLMVLRINSKFELRRLCRATGAVALVKLQPPTQDELGFARAVAVEEIGGTTCTVVRQDSAMGQLSTVVLRGATKQMLDDLERAVDDGVNAYKCLCRDARLLPAGGAAEMELAHRLAEVARQTEGLEQYSIQKFGEALEVVPRVLAENSGIDATAAVSALYAAHAKGEQNAGLDIETGGVRDIGADGYFDVYTTKWWALRLAADAVNTVLRVDQIIMAKQAGGPKPRGPGGDDE
ncbi:unnamed protein product [Pedinophyceae sp. YPF-701]|nr:unnamed protein product [Pedinophyceae sp. YPF-701]